MSMNGTRLMRIVGSPCSPYKSKAGKWNLAVVEKTMLMMIWMIDLEHSTPNTPARKNRLTNSGT